MANLRVAIDTRAREAGRRRRLAWDLESNYRDENASRCSHWRDTKKGGYALTEERDIYELIANMGARRKRACILAVIPGDVREAAVKQCEVTLRTKADVTPERIHALLEKFGEYGVVKEQIEARIPRRIDAITPAQIVNLGEIYNSLKDGMSKPSEWFVPVTSDDAPAEEEPQSAADAVKSRLRKRQ